MSDEFEIEAVSPALPRGRSMEERARDELKSFLSKKGLDEGLAKGFQYVLHRRRPSEGGGHSVRYQPLSGGAALESKTDVLLYLQRKLAKKDSLKNAAAASAAAAAAAAGEGGGEKEKHKEKEKDRVKEKKQVI